MEFTVVLVFMFMIDSEVEPLFIYLGTIHEMLLCVLLTLLLVVCPLIFHEDSLYILDIYLLSVTDITSVFFLVFSVSLSIILMTKIIFIL